MNHSGIIFNSYNVKNSEVGFFYPSGELQSAKQFFTKNSYYYGTVEGVSRVMRGFGEFRDLEERWSYFGFWKDKRRDGFGIFENEVTGVYHVG